MSKPLFMSAMNEIAVMLMVYRDVQLSDLEVVISRDFAKMLRTSPELKAYLGPHGSKLAAREAKESKFGLPRYLYGYRLTVSPAEQGLSLQIKVAPQADRPVICERQG